MRLPITFDETPAKIQNSPFSPVEKSAAHKPSSTGANVKISVIIPSYNRAEFVAQTVRSVLAQSFEGFEIIVIDDGSTDETAERLAAFKGFANFRYFYQPNSGRSAARNRGMERARGEYLMFLDSDDVLAPDVLKNLWRTARRFPASGIVAGRRVNINELGEVTGADDYNRLGAFADRRVHFEKIRRLFLCMGSYIIKKDLARRLDGFDVNLEPCEDLDFFFRFCDRAKITFIEEDAVLIRRHDNNTPPHSIFDGLMRVSQIHLDSLDVNPQGYPANIIREMRAEWQLKMAHLYYRDGDSPNAGRHFLKAFRVAPELLFDRETMQPFLLTRIPMRVREIVKKTLRLKRR